MRLVLDACVPIAATRPSEPFHAAAKERILRLLRGEDELVVPSFFLVEAAGALARLGQSERDIVALLDALTAPPHRVITVGPKAARSARTLAMSAKLRGPDALYVWLARREGLPLCTFDHEIVTRGASFVQLMAP